MPRLGFRPGRRTVIIRAINARGFRKVSEGAVEVVVAVAVSAEVRIPDAIDGVDVTDAVGGRGLSGWVSGTKDLISSSIKVDDSLDAG